jgi:hypothetical protein
VNRAHLSAFLWLRWRLRVNQFRKAGALNAALFFLFAAGAVVAGLALLAGGFAVGLLVLPKAPPAARLLVWDGVVLAFLFFWLVGLFSDLQRSEGLAIDKLLHLPVSPSGAFLVNYLSSLFSLTLILFLPGMVGLVLGEVFAGNARMLLALPLLAAFVLAVTAVTYQFQGWLASLMTNPRRRRTVIVVVTACFILLFQLPNLLNVIRPWEGNGGAKGATADATKWWRDQHEAARAELNAGKLSPGEYVRRGGEIDKEFAERRKGEFQRDLGQAERVARVASLAIPPGWLPLGVAELAVGGYLAALAAAAGLALVAGFSLWRAYRTTLRLYTGDFGGGGGGAAARPAARPAEPEEPGRVRLLEWRLPWVSEQASAVAVAAFRSLWRAPEAKMALLAPLIMLVVFGGMTASGGGQATEAMRPLIAFGAGAMVVLTCGAQLVGNQFGYDRAGFRAYVLSPAPRRDILLGKNLAVAPLALGMGLAILLVVGILHPMRIDHYLAAVAQLLSAYLVFCMLANALSIAAPMPMAAGAVQPKQVRFVPVLLQFLLLAVLPVAMLPVLLPIGVEVALAEFAGVRGVPVSLLLSLVVLALAALVYRKVLSWEGDWLAAREQKVLEVVTSVAE